MTDLPLNLPLRCRCGQVRGVASGVSASAGCRVLCYCMDCQAFARFLGRADVLDAAGGTDIFQMPPRHLRLIEGRELVQCLRLREGGVHRWYTNCCRTPMANTAGPRIPLAGVLHCFMDHQADGRPRDVVLGPPLARIYASSATGPLPPTAPAAPSLTVIVRRMSMLLGWSLRGLARPNPFFDDSTNAPCVVPRVLTPEERAAL
jgi:hypothetical protein